MTTADRVAEALGVAVRSTDPVGGGCTSDGLQVVLEDGRRLFVKTRAESVPGMYDAEAHGLRWLREAAAIPVPEPVAVADDLLVLEWIEPGPPLPDTPVELGRRLAALHRCAAPGFGLDRDNWIGSLPQDNTPATDWPTFYAARRLEPLTRLAVDAGHVDGELRAALARLIHRLPVLCGEPEPPARLHGDLWGGNVVVDRAGAPWLIDPAVHGGHREVDLAMMRLFGGFDPVTFAAYDEAHPLAEGHRERVALWQIAPLLVHVVLFGGGYVEGVRQAVWQYV